MIQKISCTKEDVCCLKKNIIDINAPDTNSNYDDVIVRKPWGYEYLVFENECVSIWMLHIVRTRKTSLHAHPNKRTSLIILSGNATCTHLRGKINLEAFTGVIIDKGAFHSTEASSPLSILPISENGSWVLEIESPPLKTDLVRMHDAYGRKGSPYEGTDSIIFKPKEILKLQIPESNPVISKVFQNLKFTIRKGSFFDKESLPKTDAYITVIKQNSDLKQKNSFLTPGTISIFKDFYDNISHENLNGLITLTIERLPMTIKISDYIFSFFEKLGIKEIFAVSGGGAMHLVDSLGTNKNIKYIAMHHEQAAAMAAEGYARISGEIGAALFTSGPGGTNAITGVCGAWIDSIPTIYISGQVTSNTLIGNTGLRQFGIQEADIVSLVKPITKYAVTVKDPNTIKYHLQKAVYFATTGRPGPVWLDIPLDIQSKLVDVQNIPSFIPKDDNITKKVNPIEDSVTKCIYLLKQSQRPVLISGYGIRLSKAEDIYRLLVERLKIPIISSWTTSDIIPTMHDLYVGRSGIMGDRAGNFAVQNSDLLLIIGSRMSIPQVGYNYNNFAREAKKIMVDIDIAEMNKISIKPDLIIEADAKEFISEMLRQLESDDSLIDVHSWRTRCKEWKNKYPVMLEEYKKNNSNVNSFYFVDMLSEKLRDDAVIVTDMGTSFTCTMQGFKVKSGQRLFTSSGHASMGFGLPGAIGACFANNKQKTICISGDGGLQMNIQELQTIVHYNLPIILFVLNNNGYLTIKLMQQNHFGRYIGSDPSSGVSCPDIVKLASAYGIKSDRISTSKELSSKIDKILSEPGPFVCEVIMPEDQPLIPRVSSLKKPDGSIVSKPIEDLYPFLDRDEFFENMIVKPVEILEQS